MRPGLVANTAENGNPLSNFTVASFEGDPFFQIYDTSAEDFRSFLKVAYPT